jgi:hypothetical protein
MPWRLCARSNHRRTSGYDSGSGGSDSDSGSGGSDCGGSGTDGSRSYCQTGSPPATCYRRIRRQRSGKSSRGERILNRSSG